MHLHSSESSGFDVATRDGTFPMCSTTEAAETLVLCQGEKEIRRVPLALRPGEINELQP